MTERQLAHAAAMRARNGAKVATKPRRKRKSRSQRAEPWQWRRGAYLRAKADAVAENGQEEVF